MIRILKNQLDQEEFKSYLEKLGADFSKESPFFSFRVSERCYTRFYDKVYVDGWDLIGPEENLVLNFIERKTEMETSAVKKEIEDNGIEQQALSTAEFIPVESSNLEAVAYVAEQSLLFIRFKSTGTYAFYSVSPDTFKTLLGAESKGTFFNDTIKGKYSYAKVA